MSENETSGRESLTEAQGLARRFHALYEAMAPNFGYETRKESSVPWDDVPEPNRGLMLAVAKVLLSEMGVGRSDGRVWVAARDYGYEGYEEPQAAFSSEEEADAWVALQPPYSVGRWEVHPVLLDPKVTTG